MGLDIVVQLQRLVAVVMVGWAASALAVCPVPLPPSTFGTRMLSTPRYDRARALAFDQGRCAIYVGGSTVTRLDGAGSGPTEGVVARHDTTGAQVWLLHVGTTGTVEVRGLAVDALHQVYVVGATTGMLPGSPVFNLGARDAFLLKLDQDGTVLWTRQLGSPGDEEATAVAAGSGGEVYVTGSTTGQLLGRPSLGGMDYFLARYDADGTLLMLEQRGTSAEDVALAVAAGPAGNAWVTGYTEGALGGPSAGGRDLFVAKHDPAGSDLWVRQRGTFATDSGNAIAVNAEGEAFVAGATEGALDGHPSAGGTDLLVMRFDSNGTWRWTDQRGTSGLETAYGVALDSSGAPVTTGVSAPGLDGQAGWPGLSDVFLLKHGRGGAWSWTRLLGGATADFGQALAVDSVGGVYVAGYTDTLTGPVSSIQDGFLVKTDSTGGQQ